MRCRHLRRRFLFATLLLLTTGLAASESRAQVLSENLKLSQLRDILVVPSSVRMQATAAVDGLDLVVWGSSMNDGDEIHPVLYFAIVQDSTILVEPTRLTGSESYPIYSLQVLPLSGRWGVIWKNDTGVATRSYVALVSPDGSFGTPFELWDGHPLTRHGAQAVRMNDADFVCWSDTSNVRVMGRWLGDEDLMPGPVIVVDSGYLFLTRDHSMAIDAGLIETSAGHFCFVGNDRTIERRTIPALDGADVFYINDTCGLYTAHDTTLRFYRSLLATEPDIVREIVMEAWATKGRIAAIRREKDGRVSLSTLLKPPYAIFSCGGFATIDVNERRYYLDDTLEVARDSTLDTGPIFITGTHRNHLEIMRPTDESSRFSDNGWSRVVVVRLDGEPVNLPILLSDRPNEVDLGYPAHILHNPLAVIDPETLLRSPGERPEVSFVKGSGRPVLISPAAIEKRSTIDRMPRLSRFGDRVFASWYSHAYDTVLFSVEIVRGSDGAPRVGQVIRYYDDRRVFTGPMARSLFSTGPVSFMETRWNQNERHHLELKTLAASGDTVRWNSVFRDSTTGDSVVRVSRPYYDPDDSRVLVPLITTDVFWSRDDNFLFSRDGVIRARGLEVSASGVLRRTTELLTPGIADSLPYHYGRVGYLPIDSDEYVMIARPHLWRVKDGGIVDTLGIPVGTTGIMAPSYGDLFLERIAGARGAGMTFYDPRADTNVDLGLLMGLRGMQESQTLVRPKDSAAILLFRWDGGVGTQTYNRVTGDYTVQETIPHVGGAYNPSGVFTGDTLWVVFEVKNGESYQVYLNAIVPDDGVAGVPVVAGRGDAETPFDLVRSGQETYVRGGEAYRVGYLVDMRGAVVRELRSGEVTGQIPVDLAGLPGGAYLVALCGEECRTRVVVPW